MANILQLKIKIKLEALITERAGMIAENKLREYQLEPMAYSDTDFNKIRDEMLLLQTMGESNK